MPKISATLSKIHLNDSTQAEINNLKQEPTTGDHFLSPEQLAAIYRTNCDTGLTEKFAWDSLATHGPNELLYLGKSSWTILRLNLCGWFQCLLWIGSILNFVTFFLLRDSKPGSGSHSANQYLYLGIVIALLVLLTGLFGFYVDVKKSVVSGFEKMVPKNASVIRDGRKRLISNGDITIGDIVVMRSGDVVPADIRLLKCSNFTTDMSLLTGKFNDIVHTTEATHANPLESRNMCYFGCPVVEGDAKGMVVAVGRKTMMGKIAGLVTGLKKIKTPLATEITHYVKQLFVISFIFGIPLYILFYLITKKPFAAFQYVLCIIVANVPEGLIVTITVCLTLSARRMKKLRCLAKTLHAVETIGGTSIICTSISRTLTKNIMTVSHLFCNFTIFDHDDHSHVADTSYNALCTAACLNIKAKFKSETLKFPIKKRSILGDAVETALLFYMEMNRSATVVQKSYPKVAEIPYSSTHDYQLTIHEVLQTNTHQVIMRGAPDVIIEYCLRYLSDDGVSELTLDIKKRIKYELLKLAYMGERVIGYCTLQLSENAYPIGYSFETNPPNFPLSNMVFIGAISLVDPPHNNIGKVLSQYKEAGIRIIVMTSDHPLTALSIARKCGLVTKKTSFDYAFENHIELQDIPSNIKFEAVVITGDILRLVSESEFKKILCQYSEIIFAKISPQQKLQVVENYQQLGHVVAVVGSGINDSPALKKANTGISMVNGSEVSKKASDMIILDDKLASVILGIKEGRRIIETLKKIIAYTLTSNTPAMLPILFYVSLGVPLPLTLMLILAINVGTDLLPAMSLAYEEYEENIMKIPPRNPSDHLVQCSLIYMAYFQVGMIQFFAGMYAYLIVFAEEGFYPKDLLFVREKWEMESATMKDSAGKLWYYQDRLILERKAQTAYFVAICWTQISNVIVCKTRRVSLLRKKMKNNVLNFSIIIGVILAAVVTYLPFCHDLFNTQPISVYLFLSSMPFAILIILLDELRKYIIRINLFPWISQELFY